ncbi:amidase signature domain-containing protein [Mucidula mucida]|nr:amidase signature domain-containing protein [Mucidula mucida]
MIFSTTGNKATIDRKLEERSKKLASVDVNLSPDQEAYLKATASEIVSFIADGKWTASAVLEAYIQRSVQAQEATNCVTEIMFDEARLRAKELDVDFASTGKIRGPFHGIPFSLKTRLTVAHLDDYEGFDSTIGFTQWANKPASEHATLVAQIIDAGGVPFVKTNVPQTMFASGGESALLALDGSALGIGSDIGGSLRMPPAYCGVYSLKPGSGRVALGGAQDPNPTFEGIKCVTGPIARSLTDLHLFCRTIFGLEDPTGIAAPLPYRETQLPTKLKFGYYTSDEFIKASPANKRAVLETVDALRKQGHECVEFTPPGALVIFLALTSADSYKKMLSHLGPDPMDASLRLAVYGARAPRFLTALVGWVLRTFLKDPKAADVITSAGSKSYLEYSEWVGRRQQYALDFRKKVWDQYGFDGIIAPVQAMPQLPHGAATNYSALCAATVLYNVLDIPAGVLPVTRVDPEKDALTEEWTKRQGEGSRFMEDQIFRNSKPLYDVASMKGMPVAIQVVGKRWEEEKVLAMMDVVDGALGGRDFGPGACKGMKVDVLVTE